jgi:ABC-type multidrug transport system ATPase subunit
VLAQLGLEDAADRLVRGYSGGMRRRLDLGASLVGGPRLLLLDEPTTGLDPRSRIELWQTIRSLVRAGTDVMLTTQYLDEADQLADHIAVIDHGRSVADGTPEELKAMAGRDVIEIRARRSEDLDAIRAVLHAVGDEDVRIDAPARRATVTVDRGPDGLATTVRELAARRLEVDDVGLRRPTLDEVFLSLTGRPAADAA